MDTEHFERILRAYQRRTPFRPFTVALVNGDRFQVDHPEALALRDGVAVLIAADGLPTLFDHKSMSQPDTFHAFAMRHPADINHPFFACGIFRPGQLGCFQLKDLVSEITDPSHVAGRLLLRDGLPIIDKNGHGHVKGMLLRFPTARAAEAYDRISALEPDNHYFWGEAQVIGTTANVLFGRHPQKGSVPCEDDEWNGWDDPLFTSALDVVKETLHSQTQFDWDLKPLFRLQMAYLLLWSAIERYVSLRYHLGDKVTEKVKQLAHEAAFGAGLRQHVKEPREVYRADRPDQKVVLDPHSPEKALIYYYQIRSNITHRGKGVVWDHDRVLNSLSELLPIFRGVLETAHVDAQTKS